jgi:hypothetical protein
MTAERRTRKIPRQSETLTILLDTGCQCVNGCLRIGGYNFISTLYLSSPDCRVAELIHNDSNSRFFVFLLLLLISVTDLEGPARGPMSPKRGLKQIKGRDFSFFPFPSSP